MKKRISNVLSRILIITIMCGFFVQIGINDVFSATSNIAAGKSVTVSKATSGKKHQNVTDGKKNISVTADSWNVHKGEFLTLDLGSSQEFNQVVVYEYAFQRTKGYKLEVSDDNKTWKTVAENSDVVATTNTGVVTNTPHFAGVIPFDKVTARYVKLTIKEIVEKTVSYIEEIEIFNAQDNKVLPDIKEPDTKPEVEKPNIPEPKVIETVPFSKENFHIYLCIGQSNMNGRDQIPVEDQVIIDNAYLLNSQGKWETAQPYTKAGSKYSEIQGFNRYSTVDNDSMNGMSPAVSFTKAITKNVPGIGVGIISNSMGGTSIEKWQKGAGTNLYEEAVSRTKKALEMGGTLKGILWLQGESCASKPTYLDDLNKVVTGIRSELGVTSDDVPFIASQVVLTRKAQNENIKKIAGTVANSDFISSEGTDTIDGLHFTAESQRLLGIRYAVKFLDKVYKKTMDEKTLYNMIYKGGEIPVTPPTSNEENKIVVNGKLLATEVPPVMKGNRLFVPVRVIFEELGAKVDWDEATQTVTGTRGETVVIMQIGSENASVNGVYKSVDVAPMVINDRTLVPIRFVAESLGADVDWNQETATATITLK